MEQDESKSDFTYYYRLIFCRLHLSAQRESRVGSMNIRAKTKPALLAKHSGKTGCQLNFGVGSERETYPFRRFNFGKRLS